MSVGPDLKPRANRRVYMEALRRMTPEERLLIAFELTERRNERTRAALRRCYPDATENEIHDLYLEVRAQRRKST